MSLNLPQRKSDVLRENLAALETWLESPSATGWFAARETEIALFNEQIAYEAQTWDAVVRLRSMRENTLMISKSFEDTRDSLKAALDEAIEAETKLATESRL